jgi:transcriptional regulator with XRE-family HTH domain
MHGLMRGGWKRSRVLGLPSLQRTAWTAPDQSTTAPVSYSTFGLDGPLDQARGYVTTRAHTSGADGETDFGSALRAYRLAAGLSQRELAERAGLSARGIQNLERGVRRPYAETVRRLARGLGLTPLQRAWLEALGRDARADRRSGRQGDAGHGEPSTTTPDAPGEIERKPATALSLRIACRPLGDAAPSAAALRRTTDAALDDARAIVERHGGSVVRVDDGGLVAVFGVPLAQEDHAVRAIHAARAMQSALAPADGGARRDRAVGLSLTIGLDSGLLDVQRRGPDWQIVEASPSPLEAAERVRRGAPAGSIRASAATARAGGDAFAWRTVSARSGSPTPMQGSGDRSGVFELDPRADGTVGDDAGQAERSGRPFVGRMAELGRLRASWDDAQAGHGQVVMLVGEAGIGKSRLLAELRRELTEAGASMVRRVLLRLR